MNKARLGKLESHERRKLELQLDDLETQLLGRMNEREQFIAYLILLMADAVLRDADEDKYTAIVQRRRISAPLDTLRGSIEALQWALAKLDKYDTGPQNVD